jgi:hypothetical protein
MRTAVGMSSGFTVAGSIAAVGPGDGAGSCAAGAGAGAGVPVGAAGGVAGFAGVPVGAAGGVAGFAGVPVGAAGGVAGFGAGAPEGAGALAGCALEPGLVPFLSSGAARTTAAFSKEERTTTLEVARMRFSDQPRRDRPQRASGRTGAISFGIERL